MLYNSVSKEILINENKLNNSFHIAYGIDDKFSFGLYMSISSIIIYNKEIGFHFHIFTDSELEIEKLSDMLLSSGNSATIYMINNNGLKELPLPSKAWSQAIYFRLIAINILSEQFDEVLYLDADIICNNSIAELKQLTFNDKLHLYAVEDFYLSGKNEHHQEKYFNSGFLYMSTRLMVANHIPKKVIDFVSNNNLSHPDQDALNILMKGKVKMLNEKFNYLFPIDAYISHRETVRQIPDDAALIHFVGVTKPFHDWAIYYNEYQRLEIVKQQSQWRESALLRPEGYKQVSRKKTHLRKNKRYFMYIIESFKYLFFKILTNK